MKFLTKILFKIFLDVNDVLRYLKNKKLFVKSLYLEEFGVRYRTCLIETPFFEEKIILPL